ncbi:MAG: 3-deoxy-D-manno-octulosonic acid transferase [Acidobacteriota bacterium]
MGPVDLWIHAVSVGEVGVAKTLLEALPESLSVLVTTVTPTGQDTARRSLGHRAEIAYLPIDLGSPIERFLERYEPRTAVFVEGEYWPLLLQRLEQRQIPRILVNGRLSDRSFPRLRRLGPLARRLFFDRMQLFGVQTDLDSERLRALGVPSQSIVVTGNLKYETQMPEPLPELEQRLRRLAGDRPLIVAGSTMPGEEEIVATAFAEATRDREAFLVLAPRHPERFDEAAQALEARLQPVARRTKIDAAPDAARALLLDSLGELASIYRVAHGCFIGGTLVPTGGHNPLEAARFGKPVVVGPSMHNFREMAQHFDEAEAWQRAENAADLARIFGRWLDEPAVAEALGHKGLELIERNRGAKDATLTLLGPHLPQSAEP